MSLCCSWLSLFSFYLSFCVCKSDSPVSLSGPLYRLRAAVSGCLVCWVFYVFLSFLSFFSSDKTPNSQTCSKCYIINNDYYLSSVCLTFYTSSAAFGHATCCASQMDALWLFTLVFADVPMSLCDSLLCVGSVHRCSTRTQAKKHILG